MPPTITIHPPTLRPSRLSEHQNTIRAVLGHDLPADFARFYAETDGLEVRVEQDGSRSGASAEIVSLDFAFDDFKPHRQSSSVDDYDPSFDEPHCEAVWSPDADVDDDEMLARMNTLRRSKLVLSVDGCPEWIVVDFAPPDGGIDGRGYRLIWLYEGSESYPLELDFPTFVDLTKKLGNAFYRAYVPRAIFGEEQVRELLAPYAPLQPEEVARLLAIAANRPHVERT